MAEPGISSIPEAIDVDIRPDPLIVAFIAQNHVLSLACRDHDSVWSANCFYAWLPERVAFVILSGHETRHGAMMATCSQVSGCISAQPARIEDIRGLQFSATARCACSDAAETLRARYDKRFPFAAEMAAPIWYLEVDILKLTDNSIGFGTKFRWNRSKI